MPPIFDPNEEADFKGWSEVSFRRGTITDTNTILRVPDGYRLVGFCLEDITANQEGNYTVTIAVVDQRIGQDADDAANYAEMHEDLPAETYTRWITSEELRRLFTGRIAVFDSQLNPDHLVRMNHPDDVVDPDDPE